MSRSAPRDTAPARQAAGSTRARPPARRAAPVAAAGGADDTPSKTIALLQRSSLPTLVQRELERMIVAGDLGAGQKLNEVAVAQMLGVSRGPVREAFRALEESGLVRFQKNRGVFVRQISVDEAREIYEVRAALESYVGRQLAATRTPEQVRALRSLATRMDAAAAAADVDAYYRLNLEFHDSLVRFAGNDKLLATYRRLVNELNLFRRTTLARAGNLPRSSGEHRRIVEHIADGDVDGAGRLLQEHVIGSRDRMQSPGVRPAPRPATPPATRRLALAGGAAR